jgi:hypothetical protein
MHEKITVNVGLQLEIPIRLNERGERLPITDLVAPYIDDYVHELQYLITGDGGSVRSVEFPYAEYQKLADSHLKDNKEVQARIANNLEMVEGDRQKWFDSKDDECKELYGMSAREWYRLSWKDRDNVKKERGVVFDNGKWIREEVK